MPVARRRALISPRKQVTRTRLRDINAAFRNTLAQFDSAKDLGVQPKEECCVVVGGSVRLIGEYADFRIEITGEMGNLLVRVLDCRDQPDKHFGGRLIREMPRVESFFDAREVAWESIAGSDGELLYAIRRDTKWAIGQNWAS